MLLTSASRLSLAVVAAMVATGRAVSAASMFSAKPHPVIVWHGLGDSAYAEGMQDFAKSLKEAFPGIYVHLVTLADSTSADQKAGFFGNVNDQVEQVCQQVAAVPELQGGADAIGFSQGGQLMRAYIERCNNPPIRNLVTFGSRTSQSNTCDRTLVSLGLEDHLRFTFLKLITTYTSRIITNNQFLL